MSYNLEQSNSVVSSKRKNDSSDKKVKLPLSRYTISGLMVGPAVFILIVAFGAPEWTPIYGARFYLVIYDLILFYLLYTVKSNWIYLLAAPYVIITLPLFLFKA